MPQPPYKIDFYEDDEGRKPCRDWIKEELSRTKRRAVGAAMLEVLQHQGINVVSEKSWGRQLGEGLTEFRVDRTLKDVRGKKVKLVLRVFFHAYGDKRLLLLHGYDKGRSPSARRQQREIETARARLRDWTQRRRGTQARPGRARRSGKRR
ncbi:MAG: type II toxin-antitoxin system RelE/ParE family toxin [Solirubrobacterales bacterium]